MIAHEKILAVMGTRFDYYSARAVLQDALRKAGISAPKTEYSPEDVRALSAAVGTLGRTEALVAALNGLADAEPATAVKAAPAPEPEPQPEPEAAAAPEAAEVAAEAPAEGTEEKPKGKKKK